MPALEEGFFNTVPRQVGQAHGGQQAKHKGQPRVLLRQAKLGCCLNDRGMKQVDAVGKVGQVAHDVQFGQLVGRQNEQQRKYEGLKIVVTRQAVVEQINGPYGQQ